MLNNINYACGHCVGLICVVRCHQFLYLVMCDDLKIQIENRDFCSQSVKIEITIFAKSLLRFSFCSNYWMLLHEMTLQ